MNHCRICVSDDAMKIFEMYNQPYCKIVSRLTKSATTNKVLKDRELQHVLFLTYPATRKSTT